jgi:hypothetical protein
MIFGSAAHALSQLAINDAGRHDVGSWHEEDVEQQPNIAYFASRRQVCDGYLQVTESPG